MNASMVDENEIRTRLHAALDAVPVAQRPVPTVESAVRHRRTRRFLIGGLGAPVVAGAVALAVVLGGTAPVSPVVNDPAATSPTSPTSVALRGYLTAHDGTHATGPATDRRGTWALDVERDGAHVLTFQQTSWRSVSVVGRPMSRSPITGTALGLSEVNGDVTFLVRSAGADASFDAIVVATEGGWGWATFRCGQTRVACAAGEQDGVGLPSRFQLNLSIVGGTLHSSNNTCSPGCADGTFHDVTWKWNATSQQFDVATAVPGRAPGSAQAPLSPR